MPTAFKAFSTLTRMGLDHNWCLCIASVIEAAKDADSVYSSDVIIDRLYECGINEDIAEALCTVLQNCFWTERFSTAFLGAPLKVQMVRAGLTAAQAEGILEAVDSAVVTARTLEARVPIKHAPSPGRVVMCDFNHLRKPEMLKERRAIVVSSRSPVELGRCAVVPVSMSEPRDGGAYYFEFAPGTYPFFHRTNPVWAVCDHIYVVSIARLWKVNVKKRPELPTISDAELKGIRALIGTALGHETLTHPG